MANTRMYLKNTRTGDSIYLAKYYPSTGWFIPSHVTKASIDIVFDDADFGHLTDEQQAENETTPGFIIPHKSAGGMYGEEWVIEYSR